MVVFEIDYLQRLSAPEILSATPPSMLLEPPVNIRGYPGIERVVGAVYHVDLPVHIASPARRAVKLVSLRLELRFLTAIASAFGWPMMVTNFLPRVTAV